jgi:hypothetical protein
LVLLRITKATRFFVTELPNTYRDDKKEGNE